MANVKLLTEVLDHIKNNPQTWRQDVWYVHIDPTTGYRVEQLIELEFEEVNSCGTAFCFAGHAAMKSGFPAPPKSSFSSWSAEIGGVILTADTYAQEQLDITYEQADVLFAGENTLEEIEQVVKAIIDNPSISYDELLEVLGREPYEEEEEDEGCGDPDCWCRQ